MILRDYQEDLVKRVRASDARRVLVQLPTGAGKSHLIQHAARHARTLVLAHAEWLIDQLHALVGGQALKAGGQWDGSTWPIVGMIQTVARRDLPEPELIIIDEAHHTPSPTYREIIGRWARATVLGFTATPQRLDGLGLDQDYDELVCGPGYPELIGAGWLRPFEVLSVPSGVDMTGVETRAGEFAVEGVKRALRGSTIFGDIVDNYLTHCRPLGGHASFWPSIDMAEEAAERFCARGIACRSLHSRMPRARVLAALTALRRGDVESLATVGMIGEGLDVPGLRSVSLCRPTKSLTVYLQQSGRCNREGGEGVARVLDHVANWQRHGLPGDDREWTLQGRVKRKAKPGELPVWTCPECWRVISSAEAFCPGCGAEKPRAIREVEERAAELELIIRSAVGDVHEICSTPQQYRKFAHLHGKQPTWAAMQWWVRHHRGSDANPFLRAAGQLRPTVREYVQAAVECDVHPGQAQVYAKIIGLRW